MEERFQKIRERVVYYWPTYGPPVLGAILVLLALFVGYRILANRTPKPTTTGINDSNLSLNVQGTPTPVEPNASVTLPAGATPTPVEVATGPATTKGGQALPETGFPLFLAIPAFASIGIGGFKLSKFKKNS
ncbi:MAG: hypothetical protein A2782_01030 [Candidatus Blackburnbacteria bacterium RIFCSPHIGHO2_01_FULL_43_15b]|uniref:Uncharacterized protein n=1 Tax=Candidatus Blackburnbacteria bacterium RIFCSPHIGHO2_01_FULL_43_15b TaxID=1797513 RepID=A0A1G1V102_9BACT|nr:MAG: hypothetical protein A2782_01030 [Candidatus Blackburnbacteria bacterium RIFCSPHIGHO2_01_FULL_43_15b]